MKSRSRDGLDARGLLMFHRRMRALTCANQHLEHSVRRSSVLSEEI